MSTAKTKRGWVDNRRDLLQEDVAAMIRDRVSSHDRPETIADELAHDIIVVVRERVLRQIESYARENIR